MQCTCGRSYKYNYHQTAKLSYDMPTFQKDKIKVPISNSYERQRHEEQRNMLT
jgi:hypothetical protein